MPRDPARAAAKPAKCSRRRSRRRLSFGGLEVEGSVATWARPEDRAVAGLRWSQARGKSGLHGTTVPGNARRGGLALFRDSATESRSRPLRRRDSERVRKERTPATATAAGTVNH